VSWIREIDEADATGELATLYSELIEKRGKVANILKVHSLNPGALAAHAELYMHLLFGRSKLSRGEREAIAVATSVANRCDYCVNHHAEALRRYERDDTRVDRICRGDFSDLPARLANLIAHATRLTTAPDTVDETHIGGLRDAGLSDDAILDATLVTAYFNFVNRIALGLGVRFSDEEVRGYNT